MTCVHCARFISDEACFASFVEQTSVPALASDHYVGRVLTEKSRGSAAVLQITWASTPCWLG